MAAPSYAEAAVPVRSDLLAAHQQAWQRLASPGSWWSGEERVAIAAELRHSACCTLCADRKKALSAAVVSGEHTSLGRLPEPAVEVVHQLTTDPARLSRAWFDAVRARGLEEGAYVEIVGVVVTVLSIDDFCRGLGLRPHPLPEPLAGEPSGYRPAAAREDGAWVPMLPNGRARGAEADLWDTPRTGNVIRAMSLVPDEVRTLKILSAAQYMTVREVTNPAADRGALDRMQVELLAARVSALNECFY